MLKWIAALLLAALMAGGFYVYTRFDDLITDGVETYGPEVMGVDVGLDGVALNPLGGNAAIAGFRLGQPEGYGGGSLAELAALDLKLDPWSLLGNHVKIESIYLEGPLLDARVRDGKTNFDALLEGLAVPTSGETSPDGEPAPAPASDLVMSIRRLEIVSPTLHVSADSPVKIDETVTLESFVLTDIGTDEQGLAPREVARHILDFIKPQIARALVDLGLRQAAGELLGDAKGDVKDKVEGLLGGLKNKLKKKDK